MADQVWPLGLQQLLSESEFGETEGDTLLRSDNDTGPKKVRRRFTRGINTVTGMIYLTIDQYNEFKTFYRVTLNGGALPFVFNHPITQAPTRYRFASTPTYRSMGGGNFTVSFSWEEIP